MQTPSPIEQILLVGNPNVGKSTLFNALCNKSQKTGNYAGVTVASHSGRYLYNGKEMEIIDLPGSYSIYPDSQDEAIFTKYLLDQAHEYSGVVYVLDALNLKRGLLLFQQIQDLGIPTLLVINQIDEARRRGLSIDTQALSELLGVEILLTNAKERIGVEAIKKAIDERKFSQRSGITFSIPMEQKALVERIASQTKENNLYKVWTLLSSETYLGRLEALEEKLNDQEAKCAVPKRLQTQETVRRYQNIAQILDKITTNTPGRKELLTEKIDAILVHKFWGYVVFLAVLLLMFQLVFFMAEIPMNWIDGLFVSLSEFISASMADGPLRSLLAEGIVPGIGGIVIFAPQIGILLYLLYLLEDSGYMARVVFLMDRMLRPFGIGGKSIVPLISGVACAIPAIMGTRNIENTKERLITILVTPFMTCAARLPVYTIIIALIIPQDYILGIDQRALALMVMYLLGFVTAMASAFLLKKSIKQNVKTYLILDLPPYKMPQFLYDLRIVLEKVWDFISGAGKVIFAVSIILWVLSYLGPSKESSQWVETEVALDDSYLAQMGKFIEPAVAPLGYDWKMGVSVLSSFAAREVFVGTMATLYSLDEDVEEGRIIDKMRSDTRQDGTKVFSFATGISVLIYYAFAMQCISTIAVVYRETRSWRWTLLQLIGMSGLAYIAAMLAYQLLK